jgi:hypothetical protein
MAPLQTVSNKATGSGTAALTVALTATAAGSCLVAYVSAFGDTASPTSVTLTSGTGGTGGTYAADNWATASNSLGTAGISAAIWADNNCAAATNAVKVTTNGTGTQTIMVIVEEWPGLALTGVVDQTATPLRQSSTSSTWSVGPTGTTTQASEIIVGCAASYNTSTSSFVLGTPGTPWTEETQVQDTSTGYYQLLAAGYQPVSSTGTFTYNGTAAYKTTACIATLKTAAGSTTVVTPAVLAVSAAFPAPAVVAPFTATARALMLDCARRFYTITFLQTTIQQMALYGFNELHLHLSDNEALSIESSTVPGAVSASHYTKAQMSALVTYAAGYGIEIIPELDMPGHMGAILASAGGYAGLALTIPSTGGISMDLSQSGAITLGLALLAEYVPVFPARDWGIGGDEWMMGADASSFPALLTAAQTQFGGSATIRDLEYYFYNQMAAYLTGQGRTPHIWDDQLVTPWNIVTPSTSIIIDVWYGNTAPATLKTDGYTLVNSNQNYLYCATEFDSYPTAGSLAGFTDNEFADGGSGEQTLTGTFGVQLCAWSAAGDTDTEAQVAAGLYPAMAALANQLGAIPPVLAVAASFTAPSVHAGTGAGVTAIYYPGVVGTVARPVTGTPPVITPPPLFASASFPAAVIHAGQVAAPAALTTAAAFPAPAVQFGETAHPAVLAGTVTFPKLGFITGTGSARLPKPTLTATGRENITGRAGVTMPARTVSAAGTGGKNTGHVTLPAMTVTGTGAVSALGTGGVILPKPAPAATGKLVFTGTAAVRLPKPSLRGLGGETFTGTGSARLPKPAPAGVVHVIPYVGRGGVTLPKPSLAGTGREIITGHATARLPKPTLSGVLGEQPRGSGGVILPKPSLAGAGTRRWDYSEVWSTPDKLKVTGGTMR